ncbi:MAG: hypothetical protein H6Q42_2886 [Deltaproteobacteria bacterium]|jgi:hypothetical protein|nr:hypothetical protein [Deltaproteobacteria bacterium]
MAWIHRINQMTPSEKEGLYRLLIPPSLFRRFRINPLNFTDSEGRKLVRFYCPEREETVMVEIKRRPEDQDPIFSIQVSDGSDYTQLNWDFLIVNDPEADRFHIDVDEKGRDTMWGRASRNVGEEERALHAGLAPGQVRRGLGLTREIIAGLEHFARFLDIKAIALEALFYHNAILYERCGFRYFEGLKRMQRIHQAFQGRGELFKKLNGENPFRRPGFEKTVRGRSWAIHDGVIGEIDDTILEEGWFSPKMYRMVGAPQEVDTFPGGVY